jgi:putative DNA primase/helicase
MAVRPPPDEARRRPAATRGAAEEHYTAGLTADRKSLARALHEAELGYVARGWWVFPLLPRSKEPFPHSRGLKDATTDRARVEQWRRRYPKANVAVATGPGSAIYVVDIDQAKAGFETWAKLEARYGCAVTLEAETGSGGAHLVFTYPQEGVWPNTRARLGPGVDTRGAAGYVVAPPSIHPLGTAYRWCENPDDLAPVPGWLLDLLADKPAAAVAPPELPLGDYADAYWLAALRGEVEALLATPKGSGRNRQLHQAACRLGGLEARGANLALAEDALVQAAGAAGSGTAEARRQVRNGLAFGRAHPRRGGAS